MARPAPTSPSCHAPTASGRRRAVVSAAGLLVAVTVLLMPAPVAEARGESISARAASAWLPFWTASRSLGSVIRNRDIVRVASPFWYEAGGSGVRGYPGAGAPTALRRLRAAGLPVVPTITSRLGPKAMASLGSDPTARRRHVRALVALAARHRYDGLDLDYEHMALTTDPAQARRTRAGFTALVQRLCARLHAAGRTCVVTVMPRTADREAVWRRKLIPAVYDYAALAAHADTVRVMTYDQHAPNTRPGPIAAIDWVERVMRYALSRAPAGKLELGIPFYGRDWGGPAVGTVTWPQAEARRRRYGAVRQWDARTASPYFRYRAGGRLHTVWYSDARASAARYALARRLGLAGVAFWAPGQEDPATWARLRRVARPPATPAVP